MNHARIVCLLRTKLPLREINNYRYLKQLSLSDAIVKLGNCTESFCKSRAVGPTQDFTWGYQPHNGPEHWLKFYPPACGKRQSPIDIDSHYVVPQQIGKSLSWSYNPEECSTILNTGEGWKVTVNGNDTHLSGGHLEHKYQLCQFHCHWGKNSYKGSEHSVNGKFYSAELHFVHWNTDLYSCVEDAMASPKGLAVLAVFLKVGNQNDELEKILENFPKIQQKGSEINLLKQVNPNSFLPENTSFWTYYGSLTTPPCHESVTWIIFKTPIEISDAQLNSFRQLYCSSGKNPSCKIDDSMRTFNNCRSIQPLNGRAVYEC